VPLEAVGKVAFCATASSVQMVERGWLALVAEAALALAVVQEPFVTVWLALGMAGAAAMAEWVEELQAECRHFGKRDAGIGGQEFQELVRQRKIRQ
jgi:hypothetical protein